MSSLPAHWSEAWFDPLRAVASASLVQPLPRLFLVLLISLIYIHQRGFDTPTPASRLDLLHSVVAHGTVRIDHHHQNTRDKAIHNGHFYSDKAPGVAVAALPAFAAAHGFVRLLGKDAESRNAWMAASWIACAWSQALPAALGGVALFLWLGRFVRRREALVAVVCVYWGAAPLPYSTVLFSHALVIGLICLTLWLLSLEPMACPFQAHPGRLSHFLSRRQVEGTRVEIPTKTTRLDCGNTHGRMLATFLAGWCAGWVLASEYTAGLVIASLLVLHLKNHGVSHAPTFLYGLLCPVLLIPLYSLACFSNPFILPYTLQASFPAMMEGLYSIGWPNLEVAMELLSSPDRGLFFWSPFLALSVFGYQSLSRCSRTWFWLTLLVPIIHVTIISGKEWDWRAGPSLGPRYLAPLIPLLALPCAFASRRFPVIAILLGLYSIGTTTLATLTDACPLDTIGNPLVELHIPLVLKGDFSPNLGMVMGLPPYASVAVFYAILVGGFWWIWRQLPAEETHSHESQGDGRDVNAASPIHITILEFNQALDQPKNLRTISRGVAMSGVANSKAANSKLRAWKSMLRRCSSPVSSIEQPKAAANGSDGIQHPLVALGQIDPDIRVTGDELGRFRIHGRRQAASPGPAVAGARLTSACSCAHGIFP